METRSDLGVQLRREGKSEPRWCISPSLYLASQLLLPCLGLRLLRAEREPLPSAWGCPRPGSAAAAAPQGASRQPPCPAPCPAPLSALAPRRFPSAAGHMDTSGGPGRCRACRARPGTHPRQPLRAAPGKPRPSPPAVGLLPGPAKARPGLASPPPTCCAGSGPEAAGGAPLWYSVWVCVSPRVIGASGWGREPVSAPLDASGQAAAR